MDAVVVGYEDFGHLNRELYHSRSAALCGPRSFWDNDWVIPDRHGRPLRNLRLSVTDRCNLRCSYCMPEADYVWLPREDILHFEEIETLVDVFTSLGVKRAGWQGGRRRCRGNCPDRFHGLPPRRAIAILRRPRTG